MVRVNQGQRRTGGFRRLTGGWWPDAVGFMPRAMRVFEEAGLHPVPAPTDFGYPAGPGHEPAAFFPTAGGLGATERAFYEAMAKVQEAMRRW